MLAITIASVLLSSSFATAQSISTSCQVAASSLLANKDASSCLNLPGLLPLATSSGSLVDPINKWITTFCSVDPCSQSTLTNVSSTVKTGCSSDLNGQLASAADSLTTNYDGVREAACLQYSGNGTYCVTELLTNVETSSGTALSLDAIIAAVGNGTFITIANDIPASTLCTDCFAGLVNKVDAIAGSTVASDTVSSKCGSGYGESVPSTLKENVQGSSSTAKDDSSAALSLHTSAVGLAVVSLAGLLVSWV